jgi:hypothetical protein
MPPCETCERLQIELNYQRQVNQQMLNSLIELANPIPREEISIKQEHKPINRADIPWRVRQQMLEEEDRAKLKVIQRKEEETKANTLTTAELEAELGIDSLPEGA